MEDISNYSGWSLLILTLYIVVKESFGLINFIVRNKGKEEEKKKDFSIPEEEWKTIVKQTNELHEWHNVKDEDGVPVWYVRRSLEKAIEKLSTTIDEQTRVFQTFLARMDDKK